MRICIEKRPDVHKFAATPSNPDGEAKFLGRLPVRDPRDAAYALSAVRRQLPGMTGPTKRTFRNWGVDKKRLPLDQGPRPACTGFSFGTSCIVGPITQRKAMPTTAEAEKIAYERYVRACHLDEWEGDDVDSGSSVRAAAEAYIEAGYFGGYAWAQRLQDVVDFILYYGPCVAGTIWPDSMMETDPHGYLNVDPDATMDGAHAAGHAYCLAHVNTTARNPDGSNGYFYIPQTWGKPWGLKGEGVAKISFRTFDAICFAAGGEVCLPTEKPLKPAANPVGVDVTKPAEDQNG